MSASSSVSETTASLDSFCIETTPFQPATPLLIWTTPLKNMANLESFVSCLLSLFILLQCPSSSYVLIDKQTRTIDGGDIHQYTVTVSEIMIFCLVSDIGDADIYVSRTGSPDSENYDFSSSSTGIDIITVPYNGETSLSVGIQGHVRYDKSTYRLFLLSPSERDYLAYQVWEVNADTGQPTLAIEVDTLWMCNDPRLNNILSILATGDGRGLEREGLEGGDSSQLFDTVKEWVWWIAMLLLKIIVEVLG